MCVASHCTGGGGFSVLWGSKVSLGVFWCHIAFVIFARCIVATLCDICIDYPYICYSVSHVGLLIITWIWTKHQYTFIYPSQLFRNRVFQFRCILCLVLRWCSINAFILKKSLHMLWIYTCRYFAEHKLKRPRCSMYEGWNSCICD